MISVEILARFDLVGHDVRDKVHRPVVQSLHHRPSPDSAAPKHHKAVSLDDRRESNEQREALAGDLVRALERLVGGAVGSISQGYQSAGIEKNRAVIESRPDVSSRHRLADRGR